MTVECGGRSGRHRIVLGPNEERLFKRGANAQRLVLACAEDLKRHGHISAPRCSVQLLPKPSEIEMPLLRGARRKNELDTCVCSFACGPDAHGEVVIKGIGERDWLAQRTGIQGPELNPPPQLSGDEAMAPLKRLDAGGDLHLIEDFPVEVDRAHGDLLRVDVECDIVMLRLGQALVAVGCGVHLV